MRGQRRCTSEQPILHPIEVLSFLEVWSVATVERPVIDQVLQLCEIPVIYHYFSLFIHYVNVLLIVILLEIVH